MYELSDSKGAARLFFEIQKSGYNVDIEMKFGTVTATSPLTIRLDSGLTLDSDDFVLAGHLAEHTRKLVIDGTEKSVTFKSRLATNDRVVLLVADQTYFILDKVEVA